MAAPMACRERAQTCDARVEEAYRTLGVPPDAGRTEVQAAYLKLLECFNPARLTQRGDTLPVLAVLKLAQVTAAFDVLRAYLAAA